MRCGMVRRGVVWRVGVGWGTVWISGWRPMGRPGRGLYPWRYSGLQLGMLGPPHWRCLGSLRLHTQAPCRWPSRRARTTTAAASTPCPFGPSATPRPARCSPPALLRLPPRLPLGWRRRPLRACRSSHVGHSSRSPAPTLGPLERRCGRRVRTMRYPPPHVHAPRTRTHGATPRRYSWSRTVRRVAGRAVKQRHVDPGRGQQVCAIRARGLSPHRGNKQTECSDCA